jgi:RNA-binding protein PNO1
MPKVSKKEAAMPLQETVPVQDAQMEDSSAPSKPAFTALTLADQQGNKIEFRRIPVPQHRLTPLKTHWMELYNPITQNMKIDMRMNLKTKKVEIKTTVDTTNPDALQKAADFIHAFLLGFEIRDAIALLRLDDLYVECFEIKDVKTLRGEHLSRCIGRLAGKSGKTKFTIENATRTRIVLADTKIHLLGSFQNIRAARDAICNLILGSPPGKVYSKLRSVTSRLGES